MFGLLKKSKEEQELLESLRRSENFDRNLAKVKKVSSIKSKNSLKKNRMKFLKAVKTACFILMYPCSYNFIHFKLF